MRTAYVRLYVHLVWATLDRLPVITSAVEEPLYAALAKKCRELGCVPVAVGGTADHLHILLQLPSTRTVARVVKELKGSSSHLITHAIAPGSSFKWQGAYGAFSVDPKAVPLVARYIAGQKQHHASGTVQELWELDAAAVAGSRVRAEPTGADRFRKASPRLQSPGDRSATENPNTRRCNGGERYSTRAD